MSPFFRVAGGFTLAVFCFLALATSMLQGATKTWDANVDTTWDTGATANWSGSTWASGDDAVFGATGVGTVTLGSDVSANSLTFNNSGYTIEQDGGNLFALDMGPGGVNLTTGQPAIINAKITGNNNWGAFRTSGAGTLTIGGSVANDSTGTITTSLPGHLILAKTGGVASTAGNLILNNNPVHLENGDQAIGGTTTFNVSYNSRLHTRGSTYTTRGLISGGSNTGVIENSANTFGTLAGTGANGVVNIVTQSGDNFTYSAIIRDRDLTGADLAVPQTISIIKDGLGTQTLTGTGITYTGTTTVNEGTLRQDLTAVSNNTPLNLGATTVNANGTLVLHNGLAPSYGTTSLTSGGTSYAGTGTIVKTGNGVLDWWGTSPANTTSIKDFAGLIDVQQGVLANQTVNDWSVSAGNMSLNIEAGAYFDLRTADAVINNLTGDGTIGSSFQAGRVLTVGAANGSSTFDGVIQNTVPSFSNAPNVGLTKTGTGTLTLTNTSTYTGATTINGGTLQLGDGTSGNDGSINNTSGVTNNASLVYNLFGNQTASYSIGGTGTLTKEGAGTLTLTNTGNSYGGDTFINGGVLYTTNAGVIPVASDVTISGDATWRLGTNNANYNNSIFVASGDSGIIQLASGSGNQRVNGDLSGVAGNLTFDTSLSANNLGFIFEGASMGTTPLGSVITFDKGSSGNNTHNRLRSISSMNAFANSTVAFNRTGGGSLNLRLDLDNNSTNTQFGALDGGDFSTFVFYESGGNKSVTINGTADGNFAGTLTNGSATLSLIKNGTATQTLSGVNNYTGTTTINDGTLNVTGQLSGSGLVTVGSPGTLSGVDTGTTAAVAGPVSVMSGGTISVGDSTLATPVRSTLSLPGGITWDNATLQVDVIETAFGYYPSSFSGEDPFSVDLNLSLTDVITNPSASDLLIIGNADGTGLLDADLTSGFTLDVDFGGQSPPMLGFYDVLLADEIFIDPDNFNLHGASFWRIVDLQTGGQVLQVAAPEPTTIALWGMIGLGLAAFGFYRAGTKK